MMTVGSLFSGIGGIELGLERTGGFRTIWQCEIDEYASAVLKKHWPSVPNLGDITKVNWNGIEKPDIICGGFPCQDISVAGKGKGIGGKRSGLWAEMARAIEATMPRYVIIENSPELIKRGLGRVLQDLGNAGYTPFRPLLLEAAQVGARHKRERFFLVAHLDVRGCDNGNPVGQRGQVLPDEGGDGEENQQEQHKWNCGISEDTTPPADTNSFSRQRNVAQEVFGKCGISWWHDAREFEEIRDGQNILKPLVCRRVYGISAGLDRIKCLGNAVVPACAQVVGEAIIELKKEG